jgi:hypothetical protein
MDLKLYREVPRDVERISSRHQHPKITQTPTIKKVGVFSNFLPWVDFRARNESAQITW